MTDGKKLEKILKALANHRRLAILKYLLVKKSGTVGDIAGIIKLSFKSTSRHLAILRGGEIVEREQVGVLANYSLAQPVDPIVRTVISRL